MKIYFLIALPLILLLILLLYAPGVDNFFIQDDFSWLEKTWRYEDQPWIFLDSRISGHLFYRPVIALSYWLCHKLTGLDASGYLLFNILVHGTNVLLFGYVILLIFKRIWMSLLAVLLFLFNGSCCEAVIWVSGRTETVGTFFGLLSIISVFHFYGSPRKTWYGISLFACFFSLCSKESMITIPFLLMFIHYLEHTEHPGKTVHQKLLVCIIPYLAILGIYLTLSWWFTNFARVQIFSSESYSPFNIAAQYFSALKFVLAFNYVNTVHGTVISLASAVLCSGLVLLFIVRKQTGYLQTLLLFLIIAIFLFSPYAVFAKVSSWRLYLPSMLHATILTILVSQSFEFFKGWYRSLMTVLWILLFTALSISGITQVKITEQHYDDVTNIGKRHIQTIRKLYPVLPEDTHLYIPGGIPTSYLRKCYDNRVYVYSLFTDNTNTEYREFETNSSLDRNRKRKVMPLSFVSTHHLKKITSMFGPEMVHVFIFRNTGLVEVSPAELE